MRRRVWLAMSSLMVLVAAGGIRPWPQPVIVDFNGIAMIC